MTNALCRYALTLLPLCFCPRMAHAGDALRDDARTAYELERKRADLDYSLVRAECDRLPGDAKESCLARAKTAHEADVEAARSRLDAATGRENPADNSPP
jgi:sigma54-dependent transcription regulator